MPEDESISHEKTVAVWNSIFRFSLWLCGVGAFFLIVYGGVSMYLLGSVIVTWEAGIDLGTWRIVAAIGVALAVAGVCFLVLSTVELSKLRKKEEEEE